MKNQTYAERFAALGHINRLEIFQTLVTAGSEGMAIGEIASTLGIPASTLSFHLRELVSSKLVAQKKEGRTVTCMANFDALNELLTFVKKDCCKGVTLQVFNS
ncbi:MAG TPA: metalloregulator ArsR/SmtB family transcription factor [Candidimonas sp.]|nr:metalloregulator ArsR/SmtB family transcription factor [Candidimonas sp.]